MLGTDEFDSIISFYESILKKNQEDYLNHIIKYQKMQNKFLTDNSNDYTKDQLNNIKESFEVFKQKTLFQLLHLDENWAMWKYHTNKNIQYLDNPPIIAEWNDSDLIIFNMFFETYLLQARSLLDCYFRHVCFILGKEKVKMMSVSTFKKNMRTVSSNFKQKGENILDYFNEKVFEKGEWGDKLRKWRDHIAHGNKINLRYQEPLDGHFRIRLYWPTLEKEPYFDLCQSISNGIYAMICDTSELLFDLKWQSGPHHLMKLE